MASITTRLSLVALLAATGYAQSVPTNLGFELRDAGGWAIGWGGGGVGYELRVDSAAPLAGRYSLRSRWASAAARAGDQAFGVASIFFPVAPARGRAIHLSGYIRTENVNGYAALWMRVDGGTRTLAFDNMSSRAPQGTTPWTRYDIELPVDSGATAITIGVLHPGDGTAWFDSLTIEVVGPARPRAAPDVPAFAAAPRPPEDLTRLLTSSARMNRGARPPIRSHSPAASTAFSYSTTACGGGS